MVVMSYVIYDPTFHIRITTAVIAAATLIGVVAAGIAVGVIVGRQGSSFVQTTTVLRSDITVAIVRPIASDELPELYNPTATLSNATLGINSQLKTYIPGTIKAVVSNFTIEPILVSNSRREKKRQQYDRALLVIVSGNAYFTNNHTGDQIRTAFNNYSETIILDDIFGHPSSALGTFSSKYSNFTDTYPTNLTIDEVNALPLISPSISLSGTTAATATLNVGG